MIKLLLHQSEAIKKMHDGCFLRADPGTGKSITALAYFYTAVCGGSMGSVSSLQHPVDLYIITTAKKRNSLDWESEAAKFSISKYEGLSAGGIKLTVDSFNNIGKYENVKDAFFIFDEQRLVGSGEWSQKFINIAKQNKWILLTATPGDTWLDYIPVFIANGFYKNRTDFKRQHVVYKSFVKYPQVDYYVNVGKLVRNEKSIRVEMPYPRSTVRHINEVVVDHDKDLLEKVIKKRWHVYEDRPLKDAGEMWAVMRKVSNSHPSRINKIQELMQIHPRIIVFYNFDYELEILRQLGCEWSVDEGFGEVCIARTDGLVVAEYNGHKHQPVPDSSRWIYLVQYISGSEAWNCTATNATIFYSQTYSYKMYYQALGRTDRLNTPYIDLYYYNMISKSYIDLEIAKARRNKKDFNESKYGLEV